MKLATITLLPFKILLLLLTEIKNLEKPTLAITWPQGLLGEEDSHAGAAQVHGGVS
jgi:hypothetical protein